VTLIEPFGFIVSADHVHVAAVEPLNVIVCAATGAPAKSADTAASAISARRGRIEMEGIVSLPFVRRPGVVTRRQNFGYKSDSYDNYLITEINSVGAFPQGLSRMPTRLSVNSTL
jgi:hypothetical protein